METFWIYEVKMYLLKYCIILKFKYGGFLIFLLCTDFTNNTTYPVIALNNCTICSLQYSVAVYEPGKHVRYLLSESFLVEHRCCRVNIFKSIKHIEINEVLSFHVQWVLC